MLFDPGFNCRNVKKTAETHWTLCDTWTNRCWKFENLSSDLTHSPRASVILISCPEHDFPSGYITNPVCKNRTMLWSWQVLVLVCCCEAPIWPSCASGRKPSHSSVIKSEDTSAHADLKDQKYREALELLLQMPNEEEKEEEVMNEWDSRAGRVRGK